MSCPNCGYCYACGRPFGYGYQRPYITWGTTTGSIDMNDFESQMESLKKQSANKNVPNGLKGCSHS